MKTQEGEWRFGPFFFRHWNESFYVPNCVGRWYLRVMWREISLEWWKK